MKYKFDFNLRGGIVIISEWFEELTSLRQLDSRKINDILFTRLKEKRTSFDFRMKIEGNFYQIVSILINIGSESSTTRYSSIRRDPTDSRRCIEFSSNRMGRMERSCITRNDGKDGDFTNEWNEEGGGRYLRSGSGNCQVQEWNWNGDRWDAIGIRSGLAAVSGSSPG